MTHQTTTEFNPATDRWEWRCPCGAWGRSLLGRSLLFDEAWVRARAQAHEAQHHQWPLSGEANRA